MGDETSDPAGDPRHGDTPACSQRLPRTTYVYLALLILSFVLPPIFHATIPSISHRHRATSESSLSDQDFERYLSAESTTQLAGLEEPAPSPAPASAGARTATAEPPIERLAKLRAKELDEAIGDYRALSQDTHEPNMDRRVLILTHAAGKPLDTKTLTKSLPENLRLQNKTTADIDAEQRLWRTLYGSQPDRASLASPQAIRDAVARIKAMHLRFLENRALADLYNLVGNKPSEEAAESRLTRDAVRAVERTGFEEGVLGLGGLIGLGLLIAFIVAAATGQWYRIRRVATAPLLLTFGTLMDGFLFYLTLYRCVGMAVGLVAGVCDWQPDPHQVLIAEVIIQVCVGVGAILYVARQAARSGLTLADIGMTTHASIIGDIGYGILGYCANLPLMFIAGLLANAIFRHSTNTEPNPVLPLMVGTHDPFSRALIFTMASVGAPIIEETFFRGVLFSGLRKRYGWSLSALISAACFAVLHPMQDWLPIFTLGFTFATMREMRQSLIPGMTAHFLQNTLSFVFITNLFS